MIVWEDSRAPEARAEDRVPRVVGKVPRQRRHVVHPCTSPMSGRSLSLAPSLPSAVSAVSTILSPRGAGLRGGFCPDSKVYSSITRQSLSVLSQAILATRHP